MLRHPEISDGKLHLVQEYPTKDEADLGHKFWVEAILNDAIPPRIEDQNKKEERGNVHKITYLALLKILTPYTSKENRLRTISLSDHKNCILLTILKGNYKGTGLYNTITMQVSHVSNLWNSLISEAKAEAEDNQTFVETDPIAMH